MNKNGQIGGLGFAIVVAIVIFIIGMTVVNFMKSSVTDSRTNMQCSNPTISDGSKLTCLVIDIVVPYFIILILSAAGGFITARLLI